MFHGSRLSCPLKIATSETGLDSRLSNSNGRFGSGIYFADNSAYSHKFAYQNAGVPQMLLCAVIIGDCVNIPEQNLKVPPVRPDG